MSSPGPSRFQEASLFVGPIVHSLEREQVTIVPLVGIVVINGIIEEVVELTSKGDKKLKILKEKYLPSEVAILQRGSFFCPGFIDAHTHAPQFPNIGLGYDKPLLDWLAQHTFPQERKFSDLILARRVYTGAVKSTLNAGTTTAVYFGTIHRLSTVILAQLAHTSSQRAFVGKVCMDQYCIVGLKEGTERSVQDMEKFIKNITKMKSKYVKPIITPRFAITCSPSLMSQLGQLAAKYDLPIQTHLGENKEEVAEVHRLYPNSTNYAEVYNEAGLLTRKTILAHCVYLDDEEIKLIKEKECSVAHCPNSNLCLQSGLCDVRKLLDAGVNVALGTDVSGGCSKSMLDEIRSCLNTSVSISFMKPNYKPLSFHEAFYLATMGGAKALNMEDKLGNFVVGKYFDALVIDTKQPPILARNENSLPELFQKFIYFGDDRNIIRVFTNGRLVRKKYVVF